MHDEKMSQAMLECYQELYANTTPATNFNDLVAGAAIDNNGNKVIDFMSYEINYDKFKTIVESIAKKHKLKGYRKLMLSNSIFLGCSPKIKF